MGRNAIARMPSEMHVKADQYCRDEDCFGRFVTGFWVMRADRQTQTNRHTHHNTSQP